MQGRTRSVHVIYVARIFQNLTPPLSCHVFEPHVTRESCADTAAAGSAVRGKTITRKAQCQVTEANKRFRDRVQNNTASQMIKYTSFMSLTPNNFTSLRELTARMAKGLFIPEKVRVASANQRSPRTFLLQRTRCPPEPRCGFPRAGVRVAIR